FNIEKAFDTQQVRPAQLHQSVHRASENGPGHRRLFGQDKTADTIAVSGLRNERVTLIGGWFDEAPRIDFTIYRLQDLPAGVESEQWRGRCCRRPVAGNISFCDDETVGEYRLLARLGCPFKRVTAGNGVDDRDDSFDVKRAAEGTIGRECLENGAGIGQSAGLDRDTAEVRQFAPLALDDHAA